MKYSTNVERMRTIAALLREPPDSLRLVPREREEIAALLFDAAKELEKLRSELDETIADLAKRCGCEFDDGVCTLECMAHRNASQL